MFLPIHERKRKKIIRLFFRPLAKVDLREQTSHITDLYVPHYRPLPPGSLAPPCPTAFNFSSVRQPCLILATSVFLSILRLCYESIVVVTNTYVVEREQSYAIGLRSQATTVSGYNYDQELQKTGSWVRYKDYKGYMCFSRLPRGATQSASKLPFLYQNSMYPALFLSLLVFSIIFLI